MMIRGMWREDGAGTAAVAFAAVLSAATMVAVRSQRSSLRFNTKRSKGE